MNKIITREVDIEITSQELAEEFWNMDSEQQADFFNVLAKIFDQNKSRGIMQLDNISMEPVLYPCGVKFINALNDRIKENNWLI